MCPVTDERVCELCWLAMKENDPAKLRELISEVNSIMDRSKEESKRVAVAPGVFGRNKRSRDVPGDDTGNESTCEATTRREGT